MVLRINKQKIATRKKIKEKKNQKKRFKEEENNKGPKNMKIAKSILKNKNDMSKKYEN